MSVATRKRVYTTHTCARCDRRLKRDRYLRSTHTGARYCYPGEGCNK